MHICKEDIMKEKILVVDDEEGIRLLYKEELTDEGLDVHLAASGEEALAKLEKDKFSLVVLDIKMPGMDGIEVLRRIKEKWKNLPVILSTEPLYAVHSGHLYIKDYEAK